MKKRSECHCQCHTDGVTIHIVPCCEPNERIALGPSAWIEVIENISDSIMDPKTNALLVTRTRNEMEIRNLQDANKRLTNEMCKIEGYCPHCNNWHYPHCGKD